MTEIQLHNSRTRRKEPFRPLDPANVRMYVCGPTVYDRAHIGNARPVVVFDVLYRLLRHVYGADHVTYARNITDVDDKIIDKAVASRCEGETLEAATRRITDETIGWYREDMGALGALPPTHEPRCTEYIPQMVEMTRALVAKGAAYEAEGHVLFEVAKWPRYGELSGRSVDDMIAGARVEVAPYKRSPMDFVLWKPSTPEQPGWDSPWGRGRPGWHIECSAMAEALLGPEFDIHGGGIDLAFPHHENELAQSACVHGTERMAQVWMHNEMLQADGKKMSKSLGNFFTVRDLLDGNLPLAGGKFTGLEIRMALLMSHYRDVVDFGVARRHEARFTVNDFAQRLGDDGSEALRALVPGTPLREIVDALRDDLDTPKAVQLLRRRALIERYGPTGVAERLSDIYASQLVLGLDLKTTPMAQDAARNSDELGGLISRALETSNDLERFAERIDAARAAKNFAEADALREKLKNAGVEVQTTRGGTKLNRLPNFDPAKLEALR